MHLNVIRLLQDGITPDNSPSALGLADHELACMQLTTADDHKHEPLQIRRIPLQQPCTDSNAKE